MLYIIGLLIILGAIFSGFSGTANISGLVATAFNAVKNKIESVIFPKNEREILIENMAADYNILDRFFSQSAENILNSKDVSEKDKQAVKEAVEIFNKSKNNIAELGKMEKEDKSIIKSVIEKVLNWETNRPVATNTSIPAPVNQMQPNLTPTLSPPASNGVMPTVIPPYCRVECSQ